MRGKKYTNEWVKDQYLLQKRSSLDISRQVGCTDANILRILRQLGVTRRSRIWTEKQKELLREQSKTKTFKQISESLGKTYEAIRIKAGKLGIKSNYLPAEETRKSEVRVKISASLQGVDVRDWNGFKETTNSLIRKSVPYQKWRTAVFERDGYKCVKCGRGGYLHADHKKQFAFFPELRLKVENGQTLCTKCHKIKTKQERFESYQTQNY